MSRSSAGGRGGERVEAAHLKNGVHESKEWYVLRAGCGERVGRRGLGVDDVLETSRRDVEGDEGDDERAEREWVVEERGRGIRWEECRAKSCVVVKRELKGGQR